MTNPHLSLHIPAEERLTTSPSKRKQKGRRRRPLHNLKSIVGNIHLLTSVPSFVRWPLNVHFFDTSIGNTWKDWLKTQDKTPREGLQVFEDYGPGSAVTAMEASSQAEWGIHALPLDYSPLKEYVKKAQDVVSFEQEGKCVHCDKRLKSGKGLHPMCSNDGCHAMGHLDCWSEHALAGQDAIIPNICKCPSCGGEVIWGQMMTELSLRVRGEDEVEKLFKTKRRRRKAAEA